MIVKNKHIVLVLFKLILLFFSFNLSSQTVPFFAVNIENRDIIAGVDNRIEIVAQQNGSVSKEQLQVTFYPSSNSKEPYQLFFEGDNGCFVINPDRTGFIEIKITNVDDQVHSKVFRVKRLEAVGYLSHISSSSDEKMGVNEIKAQRGLAAIVECCGFELSCRIIDFEVLRISSEDIVYRAKNTGNRFLEDVENLLNQAEPEDLYVFRKINYVCSEQDEPLRLEDIIIEIK